MNADDISKIIRRVFAGIVAIIVAIGQVISGRKNVEQGDTQDAQFESREEGREHRKVKGRKKGKGKKKQRKQGEQQLALDNKHSRNKSKGSKA